MHCVFVLLQTAELFQAECKMDLIDEKKSMMNLQFGLQLFYTNGSQQLQRSRTPSKL